MTPLKKIYTVDIEIKKAKDRKGFTPKLDIERLPVPLRSLVVLIKLQSGGRFTRAAPGIPVISL